MPDKLRAVEQLAKLCGFNEPEKMEIEHWYKAQQELVEVIARLRGRGAAGNNQSAGKLAALTSKRCQKTLPFFVPPKIIT